jgi:hypothetical protein
MDPIQQKRRLQSYEVKGLMIKISIIYYEFFDSHQEIPR